MTMKEVAYGALHVNYTLPITSEFTWVDTSSFLIVYALLDVASMHAVMISEDSSFMVPLPSRFAIFPNGFSPLGTVTSMDDEGTIELHVRVG